MPKIVFAVAGTGGHLLLAQALARDLYRACRGLDILFAGQGLEKNPFFYEEGQSFVDIASGTPLRSAPFRAARLLLKGYLQSRRLLCDYSPDLVIGFGSYYSAPLLAAAKREKIAYALVEPNALPGRVNRLFSSGSLFSAVQFAESAKKMKGAVEMVHMPLFPEQSKRNQEEARSHLGLKPDLFTLLVLGGSQGAKKINRAAVKLELSTPFQVVHLCGYEEDPEDLIDQYAKRGTHALVTPFEKDMDGLWRSADLVVGRAGGGTISESIAYAVPSVLIPWPGATDQHQLENARVLARNKGALCLRQEHLKDLSQVVELALARREELRMHLIKFRDRKLEPLAEIIKKRL